MAQVQRKDAGRTEATEARIGAMSWPKGGFTAAARAEALARFRAAGLPGKRDEYWRYTDPSSLTVATAPEAAVFDAHDEAPIFDGRERTVIAFVDGVFDPARSDDLAGAGLEISRLVEADRADLHWARDLYGVLEARGQVPVARPLAALNTAAATDGILIRVTGQASKPVHLVYYHEALSSDAVLHHCVKVESGGEVTIPFLEGGQGDRPPVEFTAKRAK